LTADDADWFSQPSGRDSGCS